MDPVELRAFWVGDRPTTKHGSSHVKPSLNAESRDPSRHQGAHGRNAQRITYVCSVVRTARLSMGEQQSSSHGASLKYRPGHRRRS